jgi:DNA-binding LacI/PurR family transcriptional regulator
MKKDIIKNHVRGELAQEISHILLQRIEGGFYAPGRKMDSVRQIASSLGVSTVSVQNALKFLKEKGIVRAVPGSGVIVNEGYSREIRVCNIAFVFPEIAISPDTLQFEDWVINSEIHLGLLRGAELYGAKINFIHVDEKMAPGVLAKKMKEIRENDAAIFVGRELFDIQKTLSKEMPVLNFISEYDKLPETIVPVCPANREALKSIAKHAKQCNCKKVGILSFVRENTKKNDPGFQLMRLQQEIFIQFCKEEGFETGPEYNWELYEEDRYDLALRDLLKKNPPEFLFCNYSYLVGELYECCRELGIKIGEDMRIMAKSPGLIFSGLKPAVAYMKPPIAELAADSVNYACKCLRGTLKREESLIPKRTYDFIQGASALPGEK